MTVGPVDNDVEGDTSGEPAGLHLGQETNGYSVNLYGKTDYNTKAKNFYDFC